MLEKENLLNKEELILFLENQVRICSEGPNKDTYSDRVFFIEALLKDLNRGRFDYFDNTPMLYLEKIR